jgi:ABC-type uncharacterized transport system substrate-binding protein
MFDRRTFIHGVACYLLAVPLTTHARQTGKTYRIGILESTPAVENAANLNALRKGLAELGYVEGRNFIIEYRSADGRAGADGLIQAHRKEIVELVARDNLPTVYPAREFVEAGGLMAYAINYPDLFFRFARQIDKIFHGADPGALPVEQPTKFELVINLKTAKALGLTIPQ